MNLRIPALLACLACTSAWSVTTHSESVGISTPQKRVVGTSSGIDTPAGPAAIDQRLLNDVVAALVRDPQLDGVDIEVKVDEGTVTLEGRTKDAAQAAHARDVAQDAAKGARVDSLLATKP